MFERFSDRARRVVVLAQDEARELGHAYIGTEHLLLGLIRDGDGIAAQVLTSLGVSFDTVQQRIVEEIGTGGEPPPGHIPFTPRAKKILELALREARRLGHRYIGTEHILLGIVREAEGVAAQVLQQEGLTLGVIRQAVIQTLAEDTGEAVAGAGSQRAAGWVARRPRGRVRAPVQSPEDRGPRCASCGADLAETAAYRTITALGEDLGSRDVVVVYCTSCGSAIAGGLADPEGDPEAGE